MLLLLQQSVSCHGLVMTSGLVPFVTVLKVRVTLVPQQASVTAGGSKVQLVPQATVLLVAQVSTGGMVSTTVTVWLQILLLKQASMASQVWVITCGQTPLVTVLRMVSVTFVRLQMSLTVGASKLQAVPPDTVLSRAQVSPGGVVSTTVTIWRQVLVFPQASMTSQVRVMTCGQTPLVTVLATVITTFEPLQASVTIGALKLHSVPHCTVLLLAQFSTGGFVLTTVTVWLQVLVGPQSSAISQVRVIVCGQTAMVAPPFVTDGA